MTPSADTSVVEDWLAALRENCRGRLWWWRVPVWFFLASVGWRQYLDPNCYSLFTWIDVCIHEGGHMLFRLCGDFLHTAGGTIAQLAAPIIAMVVLGKQRDYFGIAFALGWLSVNLVAVGGYMADARAMALTYVFEPGTPEDAADVMISHDWRNLFGRFDLMDQDQIIGGYTCDVGHAVMIIALLFGGWIIAEIFQVNRKR